MSGSEKEGHPSSSPTSVESSTKSDDDWVSLIDKHDGLTEFQKKVLKSLRHIMPGKVASYAAVARHVGGSARAVGQALARNPLIPDCPCHRVVRADRGLGGYARGPAAKRRLLESEGVSISSAFPREKLVVATGAMIQDLIDDA